MIARIIGWLSNTLYYLPITPSICNQLYYFRSFLPSPCNFHCWNSTPYIWYVRSRLCHSDLDFLSLILSWLARSPSLLVGVAHGMYPFSLNFLCLSLPALPVHLTNFFLLPFFFVFSLYSPSIRARNQYCFPLRLALYLLAQKQSTIIGKQLSWLYYQKPTFFSRCLLPENEREKSEAESPVNTVCTGFWEGII